MKKSIVYFVFLMASGLIFSACSDITEEVSEVTTDVMVSDVVVNDTKSDDVMMENKTEYTLEMGMLYFEPALIEVEAGDTVTVKLVNVGGFHDFVIDDLDVQSEQISAGDETEFTFTIPEDASGETYEFYCSVGNHRAQGMVGVLRVK